MTSTADWETLDLHKTHPISMSPTLTIQPEAPSLREGVCEWRALLEEPHSERRALWFRTDETGRPHMPSSAEAFVIACLFYAMRKGLNLRVRGPVCSMLIRNLYEYQIAWNRWRPDRYRIVDIAADGNAPPPAGPVRPSALSAFSGGLDSCFTVWRHTRMAPPAARLPLETGLMAHGLDIPVNDTGVFARAVEKSRRILNSAGIPLLTVATNVRMFDQDWDDAHSAGVAACLHAMGARHGLGIIPGTHTYRALRIPFGSNPVTDPLFSSARMDIVYEGAGFSREDKADAVAPWPDAMRHMRVCWEGAHLDRNCGACPKCVALGISFAVGGHPMPESMPIPDLAAAIRGVMNTPLQPAGLQRLDERLALAAERGITAPWVAAAKEWRRRSLPENRAPAPRGRRWISAVRKKLRPVG